MIWRLGALEQHRQDAPMELVGCRRHGLKLKVVSVSVWAMGIFLGKHSSCIGVFFEILFGSDPTCFVQYIFVSSEPWQPHGL